MNVLHLKETMLMNKVEFLDKTVFFVVKSEMYILIHGYIYQSYPRSFLEEYRRIVSLRYNGAAITAWCIPILSLYFWYRY